MPPQMHPSPNKPSFIQSIIHVPTVDTEINYTKIIIAVKLAMIQSDLSQFYQSYPGMSFIFFFCLYMYLYRRNKNIPLIGDNTLHVVIKSLFRFHDFRRYIRYIIISSAILSSYSSNLVATNRFCLFGFSPQALLLMI